MNELERQIGKLTIDQNPRFADLIRRLKRIGACKSDVVSHVTHAARANRGIRAALLTAVDVIWEEDQ
jgi:hypothetical protein